MVIDDLRELGMELSGDVDVACEYTCGVAGCG